MNKNVAFFGSLLILSLMISAYCCIPSVKSSPDIHQGDLILTGNNVTGIEGRFDINGSIVVEENATLILRDAILNFTQTRDFQFNVTLGKASNGHPRLVIEKATFHAGDCLFTIELTENSSLLATGFTAETPAKSVHLYACDQSHVSVSNSNAPFVYVNIFDDSKANLTDSKLFQTFSAGKAEVHLSNCTLFYLYATEPSDTTVSNSAITISVETHLNSANFSVGGLHPTYVYSWNPYSNHSLSVTPHGWTPNLTLIDTDVSGWGFAFFGSSNVTIIDTELFYLSATDGAAVFLAASAVSMRISIYGSSKLHLVDTTTERLSSAGDAVTRFVNSTCTTYQIMDQSKVAVAWYLEVHVVDSLGQDVPSANATASYPNATVAESILTDAEGRVQLTLLEKTMDANATYPVGNYSVEVSYGIYSNTTSVNMTGNQQTTLTLEDFIIPELPSLIILPSFLAATLLAALVYKRRLFT